MSLSKLSKLPPEVLSCVLNNSAIPLSRRLRLRLISNLWADIIEDGIKKETSLVLSDEIVDDIQRFIIHDDLIILSTDLTDGFHGPLSRLFTSTLTQLTINFGQGASWKAVPSLFAHLETTNLTTLKMYGIDYKLTEVTAIAAALNELSALTSLTLFGHQFIDLLLPQLKPVLSRLEKFGCFHDFDDLPDILSSSLSSRCTHLWLFSGVFKFFRSSFFVELASNLTHLHLTSCDTDIWQSISQMHRLSSLTLKFFAYTDLDSSFFSQLAPFTRLTQVKFFSLKYRTPLALPSEKETLLASIEHLTLEIYFCNSQVDYQAFVQTISAWFPNLVKLTVITWSDCIAVIRARLGKLPFSVEMVDQKSFDNWFPEW